MATEKEEARGKIAQLVGEFQQLVAEGRTGEFSEADVGSKFILRLLAALGWNTNNIDEVKEQKMTLSGPADYSLSLKRKPVILYEIKGFDVKDGLDGYYTIRGRKETFAEQAMRYGWYLKVEWVVLTNFKELRLYNTYIRKPSDALRLRLRYDQYIERFEEIWQLSRTEVSRGSLAKLEAKKERRNVDEEILEDLFKIRYTLTSNIRKNNSGLDGDALKESVHKIMNRLLVLRVSEDREIIGFDTLHRTLELWKTIGFGSSFMITLRSLFRGFDADYNTKLFEEHPCENLKIDNEVLEEIIELLYKYNFYVITSDVLGAIYEDYIGHMIREDEDGVELVENQSARRKFGIYYTPLYVVEFIIDTTLKPLIRQCQKPSDIEQLTVLDPACGSGSFLIKAFDAIAEWYNDHYKESNSLFKGEVNIANHILANNLFGVDLDPQAAEISSVNLMLKAIHKDIRLPKILGHNIRIGNSLISGNRDELEPIFGSSWQAIRPFNWH
ncbi:MAG TPA: N-6 DNA methylase, partial [Nitrososphaera sp.]